MAYSWVADAEAALPNLEKQYAELGMRIVNTKRYLNATRPINRLPVEILSEIFLLVHPSQSLATTYRQLKSGGRKGVVMPWLPMTSVCFHWRSVAWACPSLWWLLPLSKDGDGDKDLIDLVLSRRRDLPLAIVTRKIKPYDFLRQHSARTVALHMKDFENPPSGIITFLPSMSNLRTVSIWSPHQELDPRRAGPMYTAFRLKDFPQLQRLSLQGVELSARLSSTPPPLTHIELRDVALIDTVDDLSSFIKNCTQLRVLDLANIMTEPLVGAGLPAHEAGSVEAPRTLEHLIVEDVDSRELNLELLTRMSLPATTHVTAIGLVQRESRSFISCVPPSLQALSLVERIHIKAWQLEGVCLIAHAPQSTISLVVRRRWPNFHGWPFLHPHVAADIKSLFASAPVRELCVENLTMHEISAKEWSPMLARFGQLKTLTIITHRRYPKEHAMVHDLLSALGTKPRNAPLLCPALEELRITSALPEDDAKLRAAIAKCLKKRAARGGAARLSRLHVMLRENTSDHAPTSYNQTERAAREASFLAQLGSLADNVECSFEDDVDPDRERYVDHVRYLAGELPRSPLYPDL